MRRLCRQLQREARQMACIGDETRSLLKEEFAVTDANSVLCFEVD